jgi:predicted ester cyclase
MKHAALAAVFVLAACQTAPARAPASAEANAAFIRSCIEQVNQKQVDAYMACWADNVTNNSLVTTRAGVRRVISDILSTFPDFEWRILDIIADGDTVAVQTMQIGTHLGVATTGFNGGGLQGVPATGKHMEILTTHWFTLKDGKIVVHQGVREDLVMMRQLGLAPTPSGALVRPPVTATPARPN